MPRSSIKKIPEKLVNYLYRSKFVVFVIDLTSSRVLSTSTPGAEDQTQNFREFIRKYLPISKNLYEKISFQLRFEVLSAG